MIKFNGHITIGLILLLGIWLRFFVSNFGFNYDFESWLIAGEIGENGGNIYAFTHRYNYGPIFSIILDACYSIAHGNTEIFRNLIILVLTIADIGLALYLLKNYGKTIALLFFLNPISIIITGYHNQFDNIAIMIGLLGILLISKFKNEKQLFWGLLLLGISLCTKHIFLFFPIWLFFSNQYSIKQRILIVSIPYIIFFCGFIPYINTGFSGILNNVFLYKSINNFPLFSHSFLSYYYNLIQPYNKYIFIACILGMGYFLRNRSILTQFNMYCISIVCFSSSIVNQYLIIPLLAICISQGLSKYVYFTICTILLLLHEHEFSLISKIPENMIIIKKGGTFFINHAYFFIANILMWIVMIEYVFTKKSYNKNFL